jgi:hypothetical protein
VTTRDAVLVGWLVVGLGVAAAAVAAGRSGGRLPVYGALARAVTRGPVLRAGVVLGWMWLGWHAFAR